MKEFLNAALPWILVGVAIAITTVGYVKEQERERKELKRLQLGSMSLGLILGVTINSMDLISWDHSLVLSICTLWGLAIGTIMDAKEIVKKFEE